MNSVFRASPGPDVMVNAVLPAYEAPMDYAMVTTSRMFRGIVTVVLWFQKQDFHVASVHGTVDEAVAALEERRQTRLPSVKYMYARLRADLEGEKRRAS